MELDLISTLYILQTCIINFDMNDTFTEINIMFDFANYMNECYFVKEIMIHILYTE